MANNTRSICANLLAEVIYQHHSLAKTLEKPALTKLKASERAFIGELCHGVVRWYFQLKAILTKLLTKELRAKDQDIDCLLLLGIYQLLYLPIPHYAAVAATVEAAVNLKKPWAKKLINAILRNFIRNKEDLLATIAQEPTNKYSHPSWLIEELAKAWPQQVWEILQQNNQRPKLCLRINDKLGRKEYLAQLQALDIDARPCNYALKGILLNATTSIIDLPGWQQGDVTIQGEASQLAAPLLALAPGQRVLDACAAPGGKTAHIMSLVADLALYALEIDAKRLERLKHNLSRLRVPAQVILGDALKPQVWWDGQLFDRILLDAPCSGTGVIRRHPDIKLLRHVTDISKLVAQQFSLLATLWSLLKPGGMLLYTTCSILPVENDMVVANFLAVTSDALEHKIVTPWGIAKNIGRQLLPDDDDDGFYYACLVKLGN